jgi:hypothetical protein
MQHRHLAFWHLRWKIGIISVDGVLCSPTPSFHSMACRRRSLSQIYCKKLCCQVLPIYKLACSRSENIIQLTNPTPWSAEPYCKGSPQTFCTRDASRPSYLTAFLFKRATLEWSRRSLLPILREPVRLDPLRKPSPQRTTTRQISHYF